MSILNDEQDQQGYLKAGFLGFPKSGKAQPLGAQVLTPDGFCTMGSLSVGDEVIDGDGQPCKVTGVYPQGTKKVFKITFSDGTSARCCDEHLWVVQQLSGGKKRWSVWPLKEIRMAMNDEWGRGEKKYRIPAVGQVQFTGNDEPLPIHPYILGCLLGDGCFRGSGVMMSSANRQIIERMQSFDSTISFTQCTDNDYYVRNIVGRIKAILLHKRDSESKFIPKEYLTASTEDRTELLRGLFDTDGHRNVNYVDFTVKSRHLAEGAAFIARSLGLVVSIGKRPAPKIERALSLDEEGASIDVIAEQIDSTYESVATMLCEAHAIGRKSKGHGGFYRVIVRADDVNELFGVDEKKLTEPTPRRGNYRPSRQKKIVAITFDGREKCQCISVSSESRTYVTDDFIVTHNSYSATLLGIAVKEKFKLPGPIAYFDTEGGSVYLKPLIAQLTKQPALASRRRSLAELLDWGAACLAEGVSVGIVDSITHPWRELCDSYLKQKNDQLLKMGRGSQTKLQFQDWNPIKEKWNRWTTFYLNSPMHLIICGRAGYEYDFEENDDGSKELVKTGIKMKTEGEFGFEPSLLVEMQRSMTIDGSHRISRKAIVLGDRFGIIDGKETDFVGSDDKRKELAAVDRFFGPHLDMLTPGAHAPVNVDTQTHVDMEAGEDRSAAERRRRVILCEEVQGVMVTAWPGQTSAEKKAKVEALERHFNTKSWTAVESMSADRLKRGLQSLREELESARQPVSALTEGGE